MACFALSFSDALNAATGEQLRMFDRQPRMETTISQIKFRVQQLLERKFNGLLSLKPNMLSNISDCLIKIQEETLTIKDLYESSEILQEKLQDIDQEIQGYFDCKLALQFTQTEYETLLNKYHLFRSKIDKTSKDLIYLESNQQLLQEYYQVAIKISQYQIFENDILELQKVRERFAFLLQDDNYLEYQKFLSDNQNSIRVNDSQLIFFFIQKLNECICSNINPNCKDIKIVIMKYEDQQQVPELTGYQRVVFLLDFSNTPALIYINCEQKMIRPMCISQHRQQLKIFLAQYQEQFQDFKINQLLLQSENLLKTIFQTFINILTEEAKVISVSYLLTLEEGINRAQRFYVFQRNFEQLDIFQFLEIMQIHIIK